MIFELAYAVEYDGKFTTLERWNQKEKELKHQHGPAYQIRKFSGHKVNDFMVSKQFFSNAAQAWIGAQHFTTRISCVGCFIDYDLIGYGLIRQYITSLSTLLAGADPRLVGCLRVKILDLRLQSNELGIKGLCPWLEQYTDRDFATLERVKGLLAIIPRTQRNISVRLEAPLPNTANTPEKATVYRSNVAGLESYIRRGVAATKKCVGELEQTAVSTMTDTPGTSLYPGSRVSFEKSNLQSVPTGSSLMDGGGSYSETEDDSAFPTTAEEVMQRLNTTPRKFWEKYRAGRILML